MESQFYGGSLKHTGDCGYDSCDFNGYNVINIYFVPRSSISFIICSIPQIPDPLLTQTFEDSPYSDSDNVNDDDGYFQYNIDNYVTQLFNQAELFYLMRDLEFG